jgi:hypothetical protein
VTLPSPDAQPSRFPSSFPQTPLQSHSMSTTPSPLHPSTPPMSAAGASYGMKRREHALDFATHSFDLATGGLKTLTAKRELPSRSDRRAPDVAADVATSHSYLFALVILSCVVLMLIGGGIVLTIMLQS